MESEKRNDAGSLPVYGSNGVVGYHDTAVTIGPTIIIGRKGSFGKISFSDGPCFPIDTTYFVDQRCTSHNLRWLYYLLSTLGLDEFSQDTGVPGLSREHAYGKLCFLVSAEEQSLIASFLNRETAKLDQLVEKKQRLIELLQEKRRGLITQAVTKGLDPNVPMKDSGIPWLGEVPAQWNITKIKRVAKIVSGGTPVRSNIEDFFDGDIKWVRTLDLTNDSVWDSSEKITELALQSSNCKVLQPGTLMVAMYGGEGTIGKCGVLDIVATTNQAISALLPSGKLYPRFGLRVLNFLRPYWMVFAEGTRRDPNISQSVVSNMFVPLPPIQEQKQISVVLEGQLQRIENVELKLKTQIESLKEYRQALISAAVTGQIDVQQYTNKVEAIAQ